MKFKIQCCVEYVSPEESHVYDADGAGDPHPEHWGQDEEPATVSQHMRNLAGQFMVSIRLKIHIVQRNIENTNMNIEVLSMQSSFE